jgi:hypothetical protein
VLFTRREPGRHGHAPRTSLAFAFFLLMTCVVHSLFAVPLIQSISTLFIEVASFRPRAP